MLSFILIPISPQLFKNNMLHTPCVLWQGYKEIKQLEQEGRIKHVAEVSIPWQNLSVMVPSREKICNQAITR